MNHVQHPSNTEWLGAPPGWDHETVPCAALPITRADIDGHPVIVSRWRPTAEELERLNAGAAVALWVFDAGMPPVALEVDQ